MNIFDILGPVMVGPSSSHTAGAVRMGLITRKILGAAPVNADIILHGSFAATGRGHGTDLALIAGLLGMEPDDMRIPDSPSLAKEAGMNYTFYEEIIKNAHPNTAMIKALDHLGDAVKIQASSLGGGRIMVNKINDITVDFTGDKPTLIVQNVDEPGHLAQICTALSHKDINIAALQLHRSQKGGYAFAIAETDSGIPEEAIATLRNLKGILKVIYLH